jgi:hypothetical protein
MASADWTTLNDGLTAGSVDRGVSSGITPPNGGGSFIYGFNSLVATTGAVGLFANQVNFAPMAKGMSIRGALQRGASGGSTNWSSFMFAGLQGTSVNDTGYLLGLADGDPSHIVLAKATVAAGVVDLVPDAPNNGVLLRSTGTVAVGDWVHLRLDMIVNDNGDVILQCFENDLGANAVTAPVWTAIAGATEFIDDALQVNSGSAPLTSGRGGFGFRCSDVTRRAFVDHMQVARQL